MANTAQALLAELEDLRRVLDSPYATASSPSARLSARLQGRSVSPSSSVLRSVSPQKTLPAHTAPTDSWTTSSPVRILPRPDLDSELGSSSGKLASSYTVALTDAEANVDRLSRAMEAAEEEMENTFKRTTELHRSTAERRELELLELRKMMAAKERSIDSLRDTLSSTKRSLEARAAAAEGALASREQDLARVLAEAKRLKAEAAEARGELALVTGAKVSLEEHVETEMVTQRRQLEDLERSELSLRERESRLQKELSRTTTDFSTAKTSLQVEQAKTEALQGEVSTLQSDLAACKERLRAETDKYENERRKRKALARSNGAEAIVRVAELEQQLQQERRARVGAERWLEAELRSKEEMQTLFCSVRDLALDKQKAKETESQSLRAAVDKLHATESTVLRQRNVVESEFDAAQRALERENERLREDLLDAKRDINARLNASPSAILDRDAYGDLHARCRRCHDRFNLSAPPEKACGYHPGELTANGYLCCGVVPRVGAPPVFCHWRPHVA